MNHSIDISYRRIAQIITPVLIGQLSYTMMGVIDTVMVGRLGVSALAAVGLGNFVTWWLLSFVIGMLTGVNTLVAQAMGGRRPQAAGAALYQGIYLGLMLAFVLVACWPVVPWFMRTFGATPETAEIAADYMQVRLLGCFGFVLLNACDSFYRGLGRTSILMGCGFAQMILNCGLNWLLIFGNLGAPQLGAAGAAWGTVLAQTTVGLFLWATIQGRAKQRREFGLSETWKPNLQVFERLTRLSLPIAVQYFMEMGGITVFFAIIARLGDAEMAVTNAVVQAWSVAFLAAVSLSVGSTTLVGQCIGAGVPEDGRLAVQRVLRVGYVISAIMGVIYLAIPETLVALFIQDADLDRLLPFARPLFLIVVICLVFDLIFHVVSGALRGAGDTRYPMLVNIGSAWLLFVPATIVVTPLYGLIGAWSCLVLHVVVMAALMHFRFKGDAWKHRPVGEEEELTELGLDEADEVAA